MLVHPSMTADYLEEQLDAQDQRVTHRMRDARAAVIRSIGGSRPGTPVVTRVDVS